jgi:hypothetical protein
MPARRIPIGSAPALEPVDMPPPLSMDTHRSGYTATSNNTGSQLVGSPGGWAPPGPVPARKGPAGDASQSHIGAAFNSGVSTLSMPSSADRKYSIHAQDRVEAQDTGVDDSQVFCGEWMQIDIRPCQSAMVHMLPHPHTTGTAPKAWLLRILLPKNTPMWDLASRFASSGAEPTALHSRFVWISPHDAGALMTSYNSHFEKRAMEEYPPQDGTSFSSESGPRAITLALQALKRKAGPPGGFIQEVSITESQNPTDDAATAEMSNLWHIPIGGNGRVFVALVAETPCPRTSKQLNRSGPHGSDYLSTCLGLREVYQRPAGVDAGAKDTVMLPVILEAATFSVNRGSRRGDGAPSVRGRDRVIAMDRTLMQVYDPSGLQVLPALSGFKRPRVIPGLDANAHAMDDGSGFLRSFSEAAGMEHAFAPVMSGPMRNMPTMAEQFAMGDNGGLDGGPDPFGWPLADGMMHSTAAAADPRMRYAPQHELTPSEIAMHMANRGDAFWMYIQCTPEPASIPGQAPSTMVIPTSWIKSIIT